MYVLSKKRILSVLMVGVICSLCCIMYYTRAEIVNATYPMIIVIDAGHGGVDGGVTGVNTGVKESEINLAIAIKLKTHIENAGIKVIMTRENNAGLYGIYTKGFKERDMKKRAEIIQESNADLMISIHANQYKNSIRRGAQIFYSDNNNSDTPYIARFMQNYLDEKLNIPTIQRRFETLESDLYIVKCSNIPSLVIESGFLSNPQDEQLLIDEEYQEKFAYTIFSGIMSYYSYKLDHAVAI